MKYFGIVFTNAIVYFMLSMAGFLLTMLFTSGYASEREFLSVAPLTLAALTSFPVAALHGLVIGGSIAVWKGQLTKKPFVYAAILALFAHFLTAFWWLFLFLQLGEQPTPAATSRGVAIASGMTAISYIANLLTIQFARQVDLNRRSSC